MESFRIMRGPTKGHVLSYNLSVTYEKDKLSHKTRLAKKVPQTLHSNEFMEFVFMFRILLDFWTKMYMYIGS